MSVTYITLLQVCLVHNSLCYARVLKNMLTNIRLHLKNIIRTFFCCRHIVWSTGACAVALVCLCFRHPDRNLWTNDRKIDNILLSTMGKSVLKNMCRRSCSLSRVKADRTGKTELRLTRHAKPRPGGISEALASEIVGLLRYNDKLVLTFFQFLFTVF